MRLLLVPLLVLVACGPAPTGALEAKLSRDAALTSAFTTEDGFTLTFTHVVIGVKSVTASGVEANGFKDPLAKPKVIDLLAASSVDLLRNAMAVTRDYDTIKLELGRATDEENVNVPTDVLTRVGPRPIYIEGTASRQSTMVTFQLPLAQAITFTCTPKVTVPANGSATIDFRVHAQKLFDDDAGKMRFEAWAIANASPVDAFVDELEARNAMTSMFPAAHYGATTGNLLNVLAKRALTMVSLGDSGTCTGQ